LAPAALEAHRRYCLVDCDGDGSTPSWETWKLRVVIGRKNWLFSDTVAGAHTSAVLYSLIETAKANDLDPMIYLHWLFATLPSVDPGDADAISALRPYRVNRDRIAAADPTREYSTTPAVR
jgi:hypothetical protein